MTAVRDRDGDQLDEERDPSGPGLFPDRRRRRRQHSGARQRARRRLRAAAWPTIEAPGREPRQQDRQAAGASPPRSTPRRSRDADLPDDVQRPPRADRFAAGRCSSPMPPTTPAGCGRCRRPRRRPRPLAAGVATAPAQKPKPAAKPPAQKPMRCSATTRSPRSRAGSICRRRRNTTGRRSSRRCAPIARKMHATRQVNPSRRRAADRSRQRRSPAAEIRRDAAAVPAARRPEAGSPLARPHHRPAPGRAGDLSAAADRQLSSSVSCYPS